MQPNKVKRFFNKKGLSLLEVLSIVAIMALLITGFAEFFIHTMKIQSFSYSQNSEEKLREQLAKVNKGACTSTFLNKKVGDNISQIKDESDSILIDLNNSQGLFEKNFKIINIKTYPKKDPCNSILASNSGDCPPGCTDPGSFPGSCGGTHSSSVPGYAEMEISFSRPGTLFEAKSKNGICNSSDQSDCYKENCTLKLLTTPLPSGITGTDLGECTLLSCSDREFLSAGTDCYKMEDDSSGKGITSIGCSDSSSVQEKTTSFGFLTGVSNTGGKGNTFMGFQTGKKNNKFYNTFIGYYAGKENKHSYNTFIGSQAGENSNSSYSTFVGSQAGENSNSSYSTFVGSQAGENSNSSYSTFVGSQAGENSNSSYNTFIGTSAGQHNSGNNSFLIGTSAGQHNSGNNSFLIGTSAGQHNSGNNNFLIGTSAGENAKGNDNVFIGFEVGKLNEGERNIFFGSSTGEKNTSGSDNVFIGNQAGNENTSGNNNIFIGNEAGSDPKYSTENNKLIIGNKNYPEWIVGDFINLNSEGNPTFTINGSQVMFADDPLLNSSRTIKKNIKAFKNFDKALEDILNTPLFTFEFKKDNPQKKRIGFISEELPSHLQIKDKPSRPDITSIRGTILAAIKALYKKIRNLKEELHSQTKELKTLLLKELKESGKSLKEEFSVQVKGLRKSLEKVREELSQEIKKTEQMNSKKWEELIEQEKKQISSLTKELHKTKEELQKVKEEWAFTRAEIKNQLKLLGEKENADQ